MGKYKRTLTLLDQLISKLEANTGGEPLLPEEQEGGSACKMGSKIEHGGKVREPVAG